MDIVQISEIFDWLAPTSICELEFNTPQTHLRLRRAPPENDCAAPHSASSPEAETSPDTAPALLAAEAVAPKSFAAKAPCVGVFLHRHPLRSEDLAPAGGTVRTGQIIGLLQIGALLLPLSAPADGVVIEHLVRHGGISGYADELIILQAL
jgi:acetyl-CoA carboxylase biotin carboxyl carrier protein